MSLKPVHPGEDVGSRNAAATDRPAHCQYCDLDYIYGDTISGVRLDYVEDPKTLALTEPGIYFEGHYECVVTALGSRLADALQSGRLPTRAAVDAARIKPRI